MSSARGRMGVAALAAAGVSVACTGTSITSNTGIVRVALSVTGEARDTVFGLSVDNGFRTFELTLLGLSFEVGEGTYSVALTDVADNCTVEGDNPASLTVTRGQDTSMSFSVTCNDNGSATVTVATSGQNIDDQYRLSFDDGAMTKLVGPNQFVTVSLPTGSHSVSLEDVAGNCHVDGANPVAFDVPAQGTGTASFGVVCLSR